MSTAIATHGYANLSGVESRTTFRIKGTKHGRLATFVRDLIEDLRQKPLQAAAFAKHDMFREHILAMSISYFALIVLLIAISVPILAYHFWY